MNNESGIRKRRYYRFAPAKNTLAGISFQDDPKEFVPEIVGLVYEEAYKGCGVICIKDARLILGAKCIVECGELAPTLSVIRWIKDLDEHSIKVGVEYEIKDVRSARPNK